jgi:hypothetical protein
MKDILADFAHIIVYSPHYDDAFLSLGGYLAYCSNNLNKKITVIILFGKTNNIDNVDVCENKVDYASCIRRAEEEKNIELINGKLIVYDNLEAVLRGHSRRKNCTNSYPNNFSDSIDKYCLETINCQISHIVNNNKYALHLFPLAIGDHVDHTIVNNCSKNEYLKSINIGFYEDLPYACRNYYTDKIFKDLIPVILPVKIEDKLNFIANYKSQNANKWIDEILEYMSLLNINEGEYSERIWLKLNMYLVENYEKNNSYDI